MESETTGRRLSWKRREILVLIAILSVGFLLRQVYFSELIDDPSFSNPAFDADYHDYWAWGMASGDWSRPMGLDDPMISENPYFRPPAYPYLLAAVYGIAGHDYGIPRQLQFGLGLLSCVLAFLLGRKAFGSGVGLTFAGLMSTYWAFIFFEGELLAPAVLVTLALALILALSSAMERLSLWRAGSAGLLIGLFALARPNILLLVPAVFVWLAWLAHRRQEKRHLLVALALAVMTVLTVLPATVRNYRVSGEWALITANAGINFYIGNNPSADGTSAAIPQVEELTGRVGWTCFDYPNVVRGLEKRLGRSLTYSEASSYWMAQALGFIRDHPRDFMALTVKRAALFWGPSEVGNNRDVHFARDNSRVLKSIPMNFPLILAMALTGGLVLWLDLRREGRPTVRRDLVLLVFLFVLVYFVSFLPFFFAARYRVPVLPFLLLFAAYGLWRIGQLLVAHGFIQALGLIALGAALYPLAAMNWAGYEPQADEWHFALGSAYGQEGRLEMAVREYRETLKLNPEHSVAHNNLGLVFLKQGRPEEAIKHFRAALAINPGDPNAHFNLGGVLLRQGRYEEAAREYRLGLASSPMDPFAHINLGGALLELGRAEEALPHFLEAKRIQPDIPQAHLNIGRALLELDRVEEALGALRTVDRIQPANALGQYLLGRALERQGSPREALGHYRRALEIRPDFSEAGERLRALSSKAGANREGRP